MLEEQEEAPPATQTAQYRKKETSSKKQKTSRSERNRETMGTLHHLRRPLAQALEDPALKAVCRVTTASQLPSSSWG